MKRAFILCESSCVLFLLSDTIIRACLFRKLLLLFLLFTGCALQAQNTFSAVLKAEGEEEELLAGATAYIDTNLAATADTNGVVVIENIPDGEYTIEFSMVGFFKKKLKFKFPGADSLAIEILLTSQAEEIEEVLVTTTRNYEKPEYLPTRVEVVDNEEVEERSHDKPSDVSHILREQPGVQVQRTSATAGTMNIRLQGLSGRYVQVLKDGVPLFNGLSSAIGITQIPPLDLKQVEIIKGPSSTLFGGDAIAGVINLISKQPAEQPVYDLLFNGESANAYDAGIYAAQKIKWFSFSATGTYRYQFEKDWDGDHFTETPKLQRYAVSPQLFFDFTKHARLNIGATYTNENRTGGTVEYIRGKTDSVYNYFEKNVSERTGGNLKFEYDFEKAGKLTLKTAVNYFSRDLKIPYYYFKGSQLASASEINYRLVYKRHDLVIGADLRTDKFNEQPDSANENRSYRYLTAGGFVQYIFNVSEKTSLEAGLRVDYNTTYKVYALPHVAVRHKWNDIFLTRLNFGMGYKLPTVFQDEAEEVHYINVQKITTATKPELSLGGTLDLRIKLPNFSGLNITLHQLYFITQIFKPLVAETNVDTACYGLDCRQTFFKNGNGFYRSGGVETGLTATYRGFDFSFVYTLTDNNRKIDGVRSIAPLTSKHIIYMLAGYTIKNFSFGVDVYYYSPVKLSDGRTGQPIWEVGVNAQYDFKYLLLFANFENIANIRQTSFGPTVFPSPTYGHPRFSEIYGPLEGRLLNVGFKLRLASFGKKKKDD